MRAHLLVEPGLLLELLHGVDLDVEELGDADLRRDALRHARHTGDGADVELLPETTHERGIREVERGHVQLVGHVPVSYTHLRAHETDSYLVCRLLLEKKKKLKQLDKKTENK